jgi:uncharacterized membrane protein
MYPPVVAMPDPIRPLTLTQPLTWLAAGLRDVKRAPGMGLLHGLVATLFGAALLTLADHSFWFLAGTFSGFLMVAPILATGLYAMSRALELGQPADLPLLLKTWLNWQHGRIHPWSQPQWALVTFGVLLAAISTLWVIASAALLLYLAPHPITSMQDFLETVVLTRQGFVLETWLALGGILAAPIFSCTVITVPMLLDRQVSLRTAMTTSFRVVATHPFPMAIWGALLLVLTLLGFVSGLIGLVLVMPLLGHASWHAYRDVLDASGWPPREPR